MPRSTIACKRQSTAVRTASKPKPGAAVHDTDLLQLFVGDGSSYGGIPAGPRISIPNNSFRAPNYVGGHPSNSIDSGCYSCAISGGGAEGYPIKIISGGMPIPSYTGVSGGYDIIVAGGGPGDWSGAHNRGNYPTNPLDLAYEPSANSAGTISSSGQSVTGVGTTFTDLKVNQKIKAGGVWRIVTAIASNTALTVDSAFPSNLSGATFKASGWWSPNDGYVTNANTDHISIVGATFSGIYNAHYAGIAYGTQVTIGWDGVNQITSDYAASVGGSYITVCGVGSANVGGQNIKVSGTNSINLGGSGNVNTGNNSLTTGTQNIVSGRQAGAGGGNCNISADYSWAWGFLCTISARFCFAVGRGHSMIVEYCTAIGRECRANKLGQFCRANGMFSTQGDSQASNCILRRESTDGNPIQLWLDGSSASGGRFLLHSSAGQNGTGGQFAIRVQSQGKSTTDRASFKVEFGAGRGVGVGTVAIDGGNILNIAPFSSNGAGIAWRMSVYGDTVNGEIQVFMTAVAGVRHTSDAYSLETANP